MKDYGKPSEEGPDGRLSITYWHASDSNVYTQSPAVRQRSSGLVLDDGMFGNSADWQREHATSIHWHLDNLATESKVTVILNDKGQVAEISMENSRHESVSDVDASKAGADVSTGHCGSDGAPTDDSGINDDGITGGREAVTNHEWEWEWDGLGGA